MKKFLTSILLSIFCFSALAAWPTKDIIIITPYPAGGTSDQISRAIQTELINILKVNVAVKNMPGAANMVAISHMLNDENDNHTFMLTVDDLISGPMALGSNAYTKFTPMSIVGTVPYLIFGNKDLNVNNFKEKIAKKESVNIGITGLNSSSHVWISGLNIGDKLNAVPYKGAAPMIADALGGHLEYGVMSMIATMPQINAGQFNPIMISSKSRHPKFKNIPTFEEMGYKGEHSDIWFAMVARNDTDKQVFEAMAIAVNKAINNSQVIQNLSNNGMNVTNLNSKDSINFYNKEIKRFERIKNANSR